MSDAQTQSALDPNGSDAPARTFTVLIVDDETDILMALEALLEDEVPGVEVLTASTGEDALAAMDQQAVDLVLSDHRMPGMTGVALLNEVRDRTPLVPRLLMTAYPDIEVASQAINQGKVDGFLTKPLDADNLIGAIRALLAERRSDELRRVALVRYMNGLKERAKGGSRS